uniref:Phytanoyl-CoA dioxygenase family protein n=1 Tax=Macrostomum lignano TaxID=282301 RepID=A0A1I8HS86_9PLAT
MTSSASNPGYTGERHPELFKERPAKGNKPGQLSRAQLDEFYTRGFTLVRDFFTKEELDAVKADITVKVSELADKLYNAGKIKDKHEGLGFYHRLCAIERDFPGANIVLHKLSTLPPSFRAIAAHERMLNLLEDIVGPNISFNPVWNLRTKTPNNAASTVPWHQDSGYFDVESYNTLIVTAWVPLLDTNEQNGTLQMVPGCHRDGYIAKHTCCAGPTWYIDLDEDIIEKEFGVDMAKDPVTLDVPYGSFLLFNNFTPHRSLNNRSDVVRWSIDFRWQRTGTPAGLFGLKPTCEVRRDGEPDFRPDWDSFDSVDRNRAQLESMARDESAADEFSAVISGPWMKKWEIVNHNKHTDAFEKNPEGWQPGMLHG